MDKITEIIPDDMPDWLMEAFNRGQFFRVVIERIKELEKEVKELKLQRCSFN